MALFRKCECANLKDELANVRRRVSEIELEWSSTYDKLRQIVQRISKRAQALEDSQNPGGARAENGEVPPGRLTKPTNREEWQQHILAKRAKAS